MNAETPAPFDRPPQPPAPGDRPSDTPQSLTPPTAHQRRNGRDGPAGGRWEPATGHTTADRVIRWAAVTSVAMVTAIAAVISYRHAYQLVHRYGETGTTAHVLPLTIDGLIATCSLVILDCARRNRRPPWHAWALLAAGIAATLGANIAHGIEHGPIGALVAGWPALVAVGSFELATRLMRTEHQPTAADRDQLTQPADDSLAAGDLASPEAIDPLIAVARERFEPLLNAGKPPTLRTLKRELRIGHARAVRVQQGLTRHHPKPD